MKTTARLICVGKLKEPFYRDAAGHYEKRLKPFVKLDIVEIKDAPGKLPPELKREKEGQAILAAIGPKDFVIGMDERGKELGSRELAKKFKNWAEAAGRQPCFVIGGPFGLSDPLRARFDFLLCLGRMTWPHELARVMLMEQIYRSCSIIRGTGYHHD